MKAGSGRAAQKVLPPARWSWKVPEAVIRIDALGIELPFTDVYARVELN